MHSTVKHHKAMFPIYASHEAISGIRGSKNLWDRTLWHGRGTETALVVGSHFAGLKQCLGSAPLLWSMTVAGKAPHIYRKGFVTVTFP